MNAVTFLITCIILLVLLYRYLTRNFQYWKKRDIPYAQPILFFGSIAKVIMQKVPIGIHLYDIHNSTESPCIGFFAFDQPILLIRTPNLIKSVMIKNFDHFCNRSIGGNHHADSIGSKVLFVLQNPAWKHLRPKFTSTFSIANMKNMFPFIHEAATELTDYISNEKSTGVNEVCGKYSTDIICSCTFGESYHCFKNEDTEFRVMARRLFDTGFKRTVQIASYFFAPFLVHILKLKLIEPVAGDFLVKLFWKNVSKREMSNTSKGDIIDCLMQVKKNQEKSEYKFDEDTIAAQSIMFFVAGFETTGATLAWAVYELSWNAEVQSRLRQEIQNSYQEHETFSYEMVLNMKYLSMVVNETLRKYPIVPFLERRCVKDCPIPDSSFTIEQGTAVFISLLALHYDPNYFPDPFKFDPERFSEDNKPSIPHNVYMPFGEGPRMCAGTRFALLGVKVALIKILTKFRIEPTETTPVPPTYLKNKGILFVPSKDIKLKFVPI